MCDVSFTFGQRGSHFFQCPSRRDYTHLPRKLTKLITSAQLDIIHHMTLGFENSFLLTWRDKNGHDHIESDGLPTELNDFIFATNPQGSPIRNIPNLHLTLGPYNASFFVQDGAACLWMNLPAALLSALEARIRNGAWTDKPRIVALGADNDFLLITKKHAAVWHLTHYRMLSQMLEFSRGQERGIEEVTCVVMHPYRYQCFMALSRNGTLLVENVPQHAAEGVEGMRAAVLRDVQEGEQRKREEGREVRRRVSLQHQGTLRREWGEHRQEVHARAKGLRLSLSLSLTVPNVVGFGKMLG